MSNSEAAVVPPASHTPTQASAPKDIVVLSYPDVLPHIKPLAIVFFSGKEAISSLIRLGEALEQAIRNKSATRIFSHVGVILTTDIMPSIERAVPGRLYIMESTASGKFISEAKDVESGKGVLGVQIRDFEHVCAEYNGIVAVANLANNPCDKRANETAVEFNDRMQTLRATLDVFHTDYYHRRYQINILRLMAALVPAFRFLRVLFPMSEKWIFCSELVALLYREIGLIHTGVEAKNVVPMDFIVEDGDNQVPADLFEMPMMYIRTLALEAELHKKEKVRVRMEQVAIFAAQDEMRTVAHKRLRLELETTTKTVPEAVEQRKLKRTKRELHLPQVTKKATSTITAAKTIYNFKARASGTKNPRRDSWYKRVITRSLVRNTVTRSRSQSFEESDSNTITNIVLEYADTKPPISSFVRPPFSVKFAEDGPSTYQRRHSIDPTSLPSFQRPAVPAFVRSVTEINVNRTYKQ